ncbi:interleukin-8-like [Rhincodon typus]|uniref:interleukin-8-like n=1 Tax=Rhincodon typus TaxID=259920 RepID=UPI0020302CBD|nr:interleukin-8-like [Rhincodon typus]
MMSREATVIALLLLLCAAAQGFLLRRAGRCHCPRATTASIPLQYIKDIKFISRGPHCFKEQVIAVLTTGGEVCIKPHANWLKKIERSDGPELGCHAMMANGDQASPSGVGNIDVLAILECFILIGLSISIDRGIQSQVQAEESKQ